MLLFAIRAHDRGGAVRGARATVRVLVAEKLAGILAVAAELACVQSVLHLVLKLAGVLTSAAPDRHIIFSARRIREDNVGAVEHWAFEDHGPLREAAGWLTLICLVEDPTIVVRLSIFCLQNHSQGLVLDFTWR